MKTFRRKLVTSWLIVLLMAAGIGGFYSGLQAQVGGLPACEVGAAPCSFPLSGHSCCATVSSLPHDVPWEGSDNPMWAIMDPIVHCGEVFTGNSWFPCYDPSGSVCGTAVTQDCR